MITQIMIIMIIDITIIMLIIIMIMIIIMIILGAVRCAAGGVRLVRDELRQAHVSLGNFASQIV